MTSDADLLIHKFSHSFRPHRWLIVKSEVPTVRQDYQLRAGNLFVHFFCPRGITFVMVSDNNQRRNLNCWQPIDIFNRF